MDEDGKIINPTNGNPSGKGYILLRVMDLENKKSDEILVDKKVVELMYDTAGLWGLIVNQMLENINGSVLDGD